MRAHLLKASTLLSETQMKETLIRQELLFYKMNIATLAEHCI